MLETTKNIKYMEMQLIKLFQTFDAQQFVWGS